MRKNAVDAKIEVYSLIAVSFRLQKVIGVALVRNEPLYRLSKPHNL
jgi:hypothetical protein